MNIAILGIKTLPAVAGADRVVEKLVENYSSSHQYSIYLLKGTGIPLHSESNIHYIMIPSLKGKHLRAFSYFLFCTFHVLIKGQYEIVHIHNSDFGLFCLPLRFIRGMKIIGTFHGDPYERAKWGGFAKWYLRLSERLFIRSCDALTSVSKFKVAEASEIVYIPNGIETVTCGFQNKSNGDLPYNLRPNNYLMFACGRLDSTKGLHTLLDAYTEGNIEIPLFVIGDCEHDVEYSNLIEKKVSSNCNVIIVKKLLPKQLLLDLISMSRLFIFPSEVEAMSMMLLEAISCKKNVVCSNIKENTELVGEDYPYLFDVKDKISLLKQIERIMNDENSQAVADTLYARCVKRYSWKSITSQYESLYDHWSRIG
jgi:glycosyltransferase involved in cell wall biosynthesis